MSHKPFHSKYLLHTSLINKLALLCLCLTLGCSAIFAQTKDQLQKERDNIIQQIEYTNKLLGEKSKDKTKIQGEISLLNKKISLREDLIRSMNREIEVITAGIEESRVQISELEIELKNLRDDYAKMIRYAYRNRNNYDRLMYIFASDDFYQALKRMQYLQQYSRHRQRQADRIQEKKEQLNLKIASFKEEIVEKEQLLEKEQATREELAQDMNARQAGVEQLQQEEKKLKKQLKQQEKDRERLNKEIQRIIEAEIKSSKKDNSGSFALTPEAAALSANFESNKGKLPWPVERGVITGKYGQNPHPVLPGVVLNNNGIDISTSENATVRSIFKGTVSAVFSIPGAGQNVIISHGAYRTVYSNLKEVFVSKGQEVDIKQNIGIVLTDEVENKTEAHIEIWKASASGTTKQNPEYWIFKQ